jgi:hypothetical protein
MTNQRCPDCGAEIGEPHRKECDVERCSKCGGQRVSCNCDAHEQERSIWTGEGPLVDKPSPENLAAAEEEPAFVIYGVAKGRFWKGQR